MTDARTMAWANLMSAAHAFSTADSKETRAALSREAMAWAAVNGPQRVATGERSRVAGDGPLVKFGRDKGKRLAEVSDLSWYRNAVASSVDDPDKARYRDQNVAHLAEIDEAMR